MRETKESVLVYRVQVIGCEEAAQRDPDLIFYCSGSQIG